MNDDPMHPDSSHPDWELTSAYLDNEINDRERALVENSPELVRLVATMQAVRTRLSDVEQPAESVREAAFGVALADFGMHQPAVVDDLASRRSARSLWQRKYLTGVAAAAVLAVVGVAVMANQGSKDKASLATEVAREAQPFDASTADDAGQDAPTSPVRPTIAAIGGAADVATVVNSTDELLSLRSAKLAPAPTADQSPADTTPEMVTSAESRQMAGLDCMAPHLQWLADIIYIDTVAIAVIDSRTDAVQALDASTCSVLAEAMP